MEHGGGGGRRPEGEEGEYKKGREIATYIKRGELYKKLICGRA